MNRGMAEDGASRFRQAAALLPSRLRQAAERMGREEQCRAEELRLRNGCPITVSGPEGERVIPGCEQLPLTERDLSQVLEIATQASVHAVLEQVRNGFVTVRGGHRIGICGSGVVRDGEVCNLRRISSLSIRVARSVPGISAGILDKLTAEGMLQSTLILSPPGGAAMYDGLPQLDVGRRTDVLDGCPKGTALLMLLRGMNPQVLAADEITAPADCTALEAAANCGVTLLATAHASGTEDLSSRPLYRRLLEAGIFRRIVLIRGGGRRRTYQVKRLEGGAVC